MTKPQGRAQIRRAIFVPMGFFFVVAIVTGLVAPRRFFWAEKAVVDFATAAFGWLFQLSSLLFLAICVYLALSRHGKIRLGGMDAKPEFSIYSWISISLCAGIATGILFWGIAEPITHFMSPPKALGLTPRSEAAAMFAMTTTYLHWTYVPYAMYGVCALGIAYASYNMKLPYNVSSVLVPIFGRYVHRGVGAVADNLCLFAIAGGVAAILGVGTMQIATGLEQLYGLASSKPVLIAIVAALVATYVVSSYTGLDRGIRGLSDYNTKLFLLMKLFVLLVGPTRFILSLGTQAFGVFLDDFFTRATYLSAVDGSDWPRWWPIYYWAIWLSNAPLIGMFLARLVRGRTIAQVLAVNVLLVGSFGLTWFTIFGGAAIHQELHGASIWAAMAPNGSRTEIAVFAFLKGFPAANITSLIFLAALFVSIATLADSMTSTVAALSTRMVDKVRSEPPTWVKLFWGFVMSSIAIINLLSTGGKISGIDATKQIATVAGFPILFLMLLMAYAILKVITQPQKYDCANHPQTAKSLL